MGRKKVAAVEPKVVESGWEVTARAIEGGRKMVRVHPDGMVWAREDLATLPASMMPAMEGAIVRIDPPADASDAKVEEVRAAFERAGAEAVRVSTRSNSDVVVHEPPPGAPPVRRDLREVVHELVEGANVDDLPALRELAERLMAKAGL